MGYGFKMDWIYTRARFAGVVKFQSVLDSALEFFIEEAMGHKQRVSNPQSSVSVRLRDWENPAAGVGVDARFKVFIPVRDVCLLAYAAGIFFVRYLFKMGHVHAAAISAKVVQFVAIAHRAMHLGPKPDMPQEQPAFASKPRVAVFAVAWYFPAACVGVLCVINPHAVAGVEVQPRVAFHVAVFCERGNGSIESAAASTFSAGVRIRQIARHCALVVILEKPRVAARYQLECGVGSVCGKRLAAAAALAASCRIRSARIVRADRVAPLVPTWPVATKVSQEFAGHLVCPTAGFRPGDGLATLAHTQPARIGRFNGRLRPGAHAGVVAADETPLAGERSSASALAGEINRGGHAGLFQLCDLRGRLNSPLGTRTVTFTEAT
jgi:hypothetical protein